MAKPGIQTIDTTNTFQNWLDATNEVIEIIRDEAITASIIGDETTGNATLIGRFTADTLIADDVFRADVIESKSISGELFINSPFVSNTSIKNTATFKSTLGPTIGFTDDVVTWRIGMQSAASPNFIIDTGTGLPKFVFKSDGEMTSSSLITDYIGSESGLVINSRNSAANEILSVVAGSAEAVVNDAASFIGGSFSVTIDSQVAVILGSYLSTSNGFTSGIMGSQTSSASAPATVVLASVNCNAQEQISGIYTSFQSNTGGVLSSLVSALGSETRGSQNVIIASQNSVTDGNVNLVGSSVRANTANNELGTILSSVDVDVYGNISAVVASRNTSISADSGLSFIGAGFNTTSNAVLSSIIASANVETYGSQSMIVASQNANTTSDGSVSFGAAIINSTISGFNSSIISSQGSITNGIASSVLGSLNSTTNEELSGVLFSSTGETNAARSAVIASTGSSTSTTGISSFVGGSSTSTTSAFNSSVLASQGSETIGTASSIVSSLNSTTNAELSFIAGGNDSDIFGNGSTIISSLTSNTTINGARSVVLAAASGSANAIYSSIISSQGSTTSSVASFIAASLNSTTNTGSTNGQLSSAISTISCNSNGDSSLIGSSNLATTEGRRSTILSSFDVNISGTGASASIISSANSNVTGEGSSVLSSINTDVNGTFSSSMASTTLIGGVVNPNNISGSFNAGIASASFRFDPNSETTSIIAAKNAIMGSSPITGKVSHSAIIASTSSNISGVGNLPVNFTPNQAPMEGAVVMSSRNVIGSSWYSLALGFLNAGSISSANRTIEFRAIDGTGRATGGFATGSPADFAEMFENKEGVKIPAGTIVTLDGDGVRIANEGDDIDGVVSYSPAVLANDSPFYWQGRHEKDEFGNLVYEEQPLEDWDGDPNERPMINVPKEAEGWDPSKPQKPRSERPDEWTPVGLVGQVYVKVSKNVKSGDKIKPSNNGVGVPSSSRTGLKCMKITTPYDSKKGYAVAKCIINVQV